MSKDHWSAWDKCLSIIKDNVPSSSYKTWFEPIEPVKLEDKVLTIQVPSAFFYEYLEEQFIDILRKTLRKVLGNGAKLEYNVVMGNHTNANPLTVKYPTTNNTRLENRPLSIPLNSEDVSGKWKPMSRNPAAPRSASQTA